MMNRDIIELRKKLISLKNELPQLSDSDYQSIEFKIWRKDIEKIFKDYRFISHIYYERKFNFNFKLISNLLEEEKYFRKRLEEYRNSIDEILGYIDKHGDRFVKLKDVIRKKRNQRKFNKKFNYEGYKILFDFENYLRSFIENKLKEIYGDKWIEEGISKIELGQEKLINKLEYQKKDIYKQSSGLEYNFPLDYFDIKHYYPVIIYNLESIIKDTEDQKTIKKYKKNLKSWFSEIYDIRISIAHCIQIDQGDLDRLGEKTMRIKNFLDKYK